MRSGILRATLALLGAAPLDAQIFHATSPSRSARGGWHFDVGGQMASPTGEFRNNVSRAWGGSFSARYQLPALPVFGLRADLGFLNYGNERKRVPLSPSLNRVVVEQRTSNNIGLMMFGPELSLSRGPVRPYLHGFGGYSHFYTESSAMDEDGGRSFASSVNFSDGGGAVGWGSGVRIPIGMRRASVSFDAGARFTRNWTRSYLRPGDVQDQPDGSLRFNERRTRADFWQFHVGASFAPRRSGRVRGL